MVNKESKAVTNPVVKDKTVETAAAGKFKCTDVTLVARPLENEPEKLRDRLFYAVTGEIIYY